MSDPSLNISQKQAVETTLGPLLIIAGAGAGKTKTLINRMEYLIEQGVGPEKILAITFTNKAAGEMRERLKTALNKKTTNNNTWPTVATFHALGVKILRQYGHHLNLSRWFAILDQDEALAQIKIATKEIGLDPKDWPARRFLTYISNQKNKGLKASDDLSGEINSDFSQKAVTIWQLYDKYKRKTQNLDFDDILLETLNLFKQHPKVLEQLRDRWHYLHIDEYQDTNDIQYQLSKLLAGPKGNICIVGDIDQSIYSWRGANFTNINRFEEDFPKAQTILLEDNYRSTKTILEAANLIISKNKNRKEKVLRANREVDKPIIFSGLENEKAEAAWVVKEIKALLETGLSPDDIAVLYRVNFQSRALEEACLIAGLPYQVVGVRFFKRQEIKNLLAWVGSALNHEDWSSKARAVKAIPRGIGKVTLAKWASGQIETLPKSTKQKIEAVEEIFSQIKAKIEIDTPAEVLKFALIQSGMEEYLKTGDEEDRARLANLWELINLAQNYPVAGLDGMADFLADAALASDQDELDEVKTGVKLMTVHAAKGLEFEAVFVVGLENDLFPYNFPGQDEGHRDPEEERRLFYVAITRAATYLYLSYAQNRMIFGQSNITTPSPFLIDLNNFANITVSEPLYIYDW